MISSPPRQLTPFIRRRAWVDPVVRFWWLCAAVLLIISIYIAGAQYREWARLNRAIRSGVVMQAHVDSVEGDSRVGKKVAPGAVIGLSYSYQAKSYTVVGALPGSEFRAVGDFIPVHIDPNDPTDWTTEDQPPALGVQMIAPVLVLPLAVIAGLIAWGIRARLLRTCRDGLNVEAVVTQNRQSPLAPRARSIRCSASEGGRVVEVFVPPRYASLAKGDSLTVLLPRGSGRPVAAAWFDGGD